MIAVVKEGEFTGAVYESLSSEIIMFHKECKFAVTESSTGDFDKLSFRKPLESEVKSGQLEARRILYSEISDPLFAEYNFDKEINSERADEKKSKWLESVKKIKKDWPI